jgi:hypothetical protein
MYHLLSRRCPVFDVNEKMIRDATTVYENDAGDFLEVVGQRLALAGASFSCEEKSYTGYPSLHRFNGQESQNQRDQQGYHWKHRHEYGHRWCIDAIALYHNRPLIPWQPFQAASF